MIDGVTRLEPARCHDGQAACLRGTLTFRRALDISGKPQDGLVGNLTYRYLDMVAGKRPNIDRLEATLPYRGWAGDVGFDIGLPYTDEIERKSLADEHRFGFTLGVIY